MKIILTVKNEKKIEKKKNWKLQRVDYKNLRSEDNYYEIFCK